MNQFLSLVRQVMLHTGRKRPTRTELERIEQWWQESHECCPEAIAAEMQQVAPEWDTLNKWPEVPHDAQPRLETVEGDSEGQSSQNALRRARSRLLRFLKIERRSLKLLLHGEHNTNQQTKLKNENTKNQRTEELRMETDRLRNRGRLKTKPGARPDNAHFRKYVGT